MEIETEAVTAEDIQVQADSAGTGDGIACPKCGSVPPLIEFPLGDSLYYVAWCKGCRQANAIGTTSDWQHIEIGQEFSILNKFVVPVAVTEPEASEAV